MSVMLPGTLSVQRVSGVNGEFSVGKLECELGVLNIKDPQLDQYETGKYQGRFGIERIYPHGYMTRTGCFIVEVRAILNEHIIHSDNPDNLDAEVALTEVDPLLESTPAVVSTAIRSDPAQSTTNQPVNPPQADETRSHSQEPLAELFGELWPLADVVMLDPTTIRSDAENHRKRTQYLKSQGYKFKATSQSWVKQGATGNGVAATVL